MLQTTTQTLNGQKQPFEDLPPIENGDFPANQVSLLEGTSLAEWLLHILKANHHLMAGLPTSPPHTPQRNKAF